MDPRFDHLELSRIELAAPRRKRTARFPKREDKQDHGRKLLDEADSVSTRLQSKKEAAPPNINPKLIFKLVPAPKRTISEADVAALDLHLLGIDPKKTVVVFPDEAALTTLKSKLRHYSGGVEDGYAYDFLSSLEGIAELQPEDRIGPRLAATPLQEGEVRALDIELWHTGDRSECLDQVDAIREFLRDESERADGSGELGVTDSYVGTSLVLLRAKLNLNALNTLVGGAPFDFVKEIERRPQPTFTYGEVRRIGLSEISIGEFTPEELVGVVVLDSGVAQLHPLIAPVLGDAQVFPDSMASRITGGPGDGDAATPGHGTAVSGIAAYGDISTQLSSRTFTPSALLFSARITDDNNEYDENELLEHQLESAVSYFLENYPQAKVVNISLGNRYGVYSDEKYQFRLASLVDDLAYRFRDREIVFVVSSGNYVHECDNDESFVRDYPHYLISNNDARIIDPATSAIALTVGGLSAGFGTPVGFDEDSTAKAVAGTAGWPSPFTRTGWGLGGAIKPEIVDYAGDMRFSDGRVSRVPMWAGITTLSKDVAPPEGTLFRTLSGTSLAAPKIANLASRLFKEIPTASSNMIRALILDSARVPRSRPVPLNDLRDDDQQLLQIYGYGQPDFDRARWSSSERALLVVDDNIRLDTFQLYEVPSLPESFFQGRGSGYISVSLAFDPPTRRTRADSYLGVQMDFGLYRNIAPSQLADAIRAWDQAEKQDQGGKDLPTLTSLREDSESPFACELKPGPKRRMKGTAQRGVMRISSSRWAYNQEPLTLALMSP